MGTTLSRKELIRKLKDLGFIGPFSGGKHQFMQKDKLKLRIPNPHTGDIHVSLIKEILRQANISREKWEKV